MARLTKRQKLLRDNPDFYKQIRAKRTVYKRHAGQFTSESSRKALQSRYDGDKPNKELQYIGYVCLSGSGYVFRKFAVPIRRSTRPVGNFSPEELAAMAQDIANVNGGEGSGSD